MIEYLLFVLGLVFLVKGADLLVDGATSLAHKLGVSSLIIGLSIVSFGTSMPELFVNIFAVSQGSAEIAFGNIVGSNLSNILLVLGITAIIYPLKIRHSTVWREIPFAFLAVLVLFVVSNDFIIDNIKTEVLTRVDALILLLFFVVFIVYLFGSVKKKKVEFKDKEVKVKERNIGKAVFVILLGVLGLYFGGKWVVEGAIFIAQNFGFSEFMISAVIVAIGTSLPELVTSVVAALRKDVDLAVGNIVGSNIFNILWILGVTALIAPVKIPGFINTDLIILAAVSLLLFALMFFRKKYVLGKWKGILFIFIYLNYIAFLVVRG